MEYFVLYDLNDNVICYYDNLDDFISKYKYAKKEINRKYRNSLTNYIYLIIEQQFFKLYKFS